MMREEHIECSDFEEGNCPLSHNPNNIIQGIYPTLLDMYKECCKKSTRGESEQNILFCVGEKLYESYIYMAKARSQVCLTLCIDKYTKNKFAESVVDEDE